MSFDISQRENEDSAEYGNFVEEFLDKVSIKTIMSGSRSIGRNEARLMLAQFRDCNIEFVTYDDPGVLMLDGLPLSELEQFLESGGESLEFAIRGPQNEENFLTTDNATNQAPSSTLSQLRSTLDAFRQSTNSADKDRLRGEFFFLYNGLAASSREAIQPQIRSQIENTLLMDEAHQEQLLMTVTLPSVNEEEKEMEAHRPRMGSEVEGMVTGPSGYYPKGSTGGSYGGEKMPGMDRVGSVTDLVVSTQSKSLRVWLFKNCGSQHVWFFIAGFFLFWTFFIQTWVDYAFGEMWRALLMELLCLASILICMMEADTQFIRMQIQERLYNYYQFLSTVEGRTWFYTFLCFLAFGKLTIYDVMAVFGGLILLSLTLTRFMLYQWSESCIDDFVITLHDSSLMREAFKKLDTDNDGYLLMKDMDEMLDANFAKCCCCRGWLKEIIFWRMDQATNDGRIDIHEFVQFCLHFREELEISAERRESKKATLRSISKRSLDAK